MTQSAIKLELLKLNKKTEDTLLIGVGCSTYDLLVFWICILIFKGNLKGIR